MKNIPTQQEHPDGLHQRYQIRKVVKIQDEFMGLPLGTERWTTKPVDEDAEYFVLRLDEGGKDPNHIAACRIGVHAYADAIEPHIPELAKDLRERYPLLTQESNVSSQEPDESKKTVFVNNDTLVKLMLQYIKLDYAIMRKREEKNEAVKRQDFQSAVTIREQEVELTKKYFALCDELQIKDLNPQEADATASKEIGEPLVQNKS